MTKLDGDARGGAALSVRAVTGAPILFAGVGEKLDALEVFHPDRHGDAHPRHGRRADADRARRARVDDEQALALQRKLRRDEFTSRTSAISCARAQDGRPLG